MSSRSGSAWRIELAPRAQRDIAALDDVVRTRVVRFLEERVQPHPFRVGAALSGQFAGLWRYRVGDDRSSARSTATGS